MKINTKIKLKTKMITKLNTKIKKMTAEKQKEILQKRSLISKISEVSAKNLGSV